MPVEAGVQTFYKNKPGFLPLASAKPSFATA